MSAVDGSRNTSLIGLPSGQLCVRTLKIFTNSAVVRSVAGLATSATTANCFAWTRQQAPTSHITISNWRQHVTMHNFRLGRFCLGMTKVTSVDHLWERGGAGVAGGPGLLPGRGRRPA